MLRATFHRVAASMALATLVSACAASGGVSSAPPPVPSVAEATPQQTPEPTPSPTPEPLNFDSRCSDWEAAQSGDQLAHAAYLLALFGNPDGPARELAPLITERCNEAPATTGLDSLMAITFLDDPRFARPTPVPTPEPTPVSYVQLTARDWDLLVKTPDDYTGNGYSIWGCITQFDAATGEGAFLATSAEGPLEYWYSDGDQAYFVGAADLLRDFVEDDVVSMNVISEGSFSFDTQAGGNTTVPQFEVTAITLQGSCA